MLLDRRRFLAAAAAGLALPNVGRAAGAKRLVVVFAEGGWDVSYCMDPKFSSDDVDGPQAHEDPNNPDDREAVRTFGELPIVVNDVKRPAVTRFFENWASRTAAVNGIWMGAIAHPQGRVRILTGSQTQANPAFATIAGHVLGVDLPLGSIDLSGGSYAGYLAASTGSIGYQSQIQALILEDASFAAPKGADYTLPLFRPDSDDLALLRQHLERRVTAVRPKWQDGGKNDRLLDGRAEALIRSGRFRVEGAETIAKLRLGAAPSLTDQVDLAVDFLQGDLCRAVTLDSRRFWDTHDDNFLQHSNYQSTFEGLDHLMSRLEETGLLDDTLVVALSEFTRTPLYNSSGGKDHWPHASMLLAGAGVNGGRAYGGTDPRIESLEVNLDTGEVDPDGQLNKYDSMAAGILETLGIDPAEWFPTIPPFRGCFV